MAQHSRINTDIKLVREIDIENASKDELIEYLCQTIHYEVEKGEDADCDLIRECSDWLGELTADKIVFTPEELDSKLEAIKSGKDTTNTAKPHKPSHIHHVTQRKVFARVTILVASLVLLSFLSLSALAMHAGYDSTWEYLVINVNKILGLGVGEQLDAGGITFIKYSESIVYSSMSELLVTEGINILYPQLIPNDQRITQVRLVKKNNDNYTLCLAFSNDSYVFNVSNFYSTDITNLNKFECVTVNDLQYYIIQKNHDVFFAILQYNGFEYTIQAPNYDDLTIIINNTKG